MSIWMILRVTAGQEASRRGILRIRRLRPRLNRVLGATSWANPQDTPASRREASGASRMIRPTRASSRPGPKNRIAGSSPSRRSSSIDGQQIEPASTAAKFPPEAVLILSEAFLTAELLEAMGMPDEPEGPLARVTPFRHATSLAIFSIRFKSMFCVAAPDRACLGG